MTTRGHYGGACVANSIEGVRFGTGSWGPIYRQSQNGHLEMNLVFSSRLSPDYR